MPQISRSTAALRIIGESIQPKEITKLLGCEPTFSCKKGDARNTKDKKKRSTYKKGLWRLDAPEESPGNLDNQIVVILNRVSDDLEVWANLAKELDINVICLLFMDGYNEGMEILPKSLLELGKRNISLGLDIYSPYE